MEDEAKFYAKLCDRLKTLRLNLNFTQDQLANALHRDRSTYSYCELGKTRLSLYEIYQLSQIFEIPIAFLLEGTPKSEISKLRSRPEASEIHPREYQEVVVLMRLMSKDQLKVLSRMARDLYHKN